MFCRAVYSVMNKEMWHCPKNGHVEVYRVPRTLAPTREDNNQFLLIRAKQMPTKRTYDNIDSVAEVLALLSNICKKCPHLSFGTIVPRPPQKTTTNHVAAR